MDRQELQEAVEMVNTMPNPEAITQEIKNADASLRKSLIRLTELEARPEVLRNLVEAIGIVGCFPHSQLALAGISHDSIHEHLEMIRAEFRKQIEELKHEINAAR